MPRERTASPTRRRSASGARAAVGPFDPAPDLLLHNGTVITLDAASRTAEAVAIRNGRITAVGETAALCRSAGPGTRRIDLHGRTVLPGLFDAHPHTDREGLRPLGGRPIAGLRSVAEIVEAVRQAARTTPPGSWIVLMPLGEPPHDYVSRPDQLRDGRFPTREDLDAATAEHPVYIRAVWGWWSRRPFPSVANSMALRLAGVTRGTPAPHNVEILTDSRGEPTGVFLERNYVPVLEYTLFRMLPRFTYADRLESVRLGTRAYAAAGTTAGYEGHGLSPALLRAYRAVREAGGLPLRMHAPVSVPSAVLDDRGVVEFLHQVSAYASDRGSGDDRFRMEGITLGGTADPAVAEIIAAGYPYEQWAGHFYQAMPLDRFIRLGTEAARLGLRVNVVVSRDLEYALRGFEAIDAEVPIRDRRWVAIHVNQATDEQLRRMKTLGVVATATPGFLWMASDRYGLDALGEQGVPLRRLVDAGIPVALGSDGVPISMLWSVWEALARWDDDGKRRMGESRLTREEALRLAIQGGPLLTWSEDRLGSLEAGKIADLTVLEDDPLSCPEERIKEIPVAMTVVDGAIVHGPDPSAGA